MKKTKIACLLTICLLILASCAQAPDSDNAKVEDAKPVPEESKTKGKKFETASGVAVKNVDLKNSTIAWVGTKPTGQHNGFFALKNGRITVKDDKIVGGDFVIDINSISVVDLQGEMAEKLKGHLLSDDFFKAANFPEGKFTITNIAIIEDADKDKAKFKGATHNVKGNLTLLGKSKSIEFPARLFVSDKDITVQANFNINRNDWGISYGNDKSLGDKFIKPDVNLRLNIKA